MVGLPDVNVLGVIDEAGRPGCRCLFAAGDDYAPLVAFAR